VASLFGLSTDELAVTGCGFTSKLLLHIAVSYIATHSVKITFVFIVVNFCWDIIYKHLFPRAEKLQLINLTPCTPVEMQLVSELDFVNVTVCYHMHA